MQTTVQTICLVCGLAIFCRFCPGSENSLTIMAENMPPFNLEREGKVYGISTDLLLAAFERIHQPIPRETILIYPWARAYRMIQEEPKTVLYSVARTEQREPLFAWVGPITTFSVGLIAPKKAKIRLTSAADAARYRIGTVRDGAPEQLLIKAGVDEKLFDRAGTVQQNVEKLRSGRIDLFAFNIPTTIYVMREMNMNPEEYEVVWELARTDVCYAFHKSTDPDLIAKLNRAIEELKQKPESGPSEFDTIVSRYLGEGGFSSIDMKPIAGKNEAQPLQPSSQKKESFAR